MYAPERTKTVTYSGHTVVTSHTYPRVLAEIQKRVEYALGLRVSVLSAFDPSNLSNSDSKSKSNPDSKDYSKVDEDEDNDNGGAFDHVMLNRYASGQVYIGRHRDTKENKVCFSLVFFFRLN